MKLKYTTLNSSFERPYAEITVWHGGRETPYLTLVDSGADINVFSASLANDLGINLDNGRPLTVRGATGEAETFYMHPVTLSVGGLSFETTAAFADVPHLELAGLAGQRGFFDHFRIAFDFESGEFDITPNEATLNHSS